MGKNRSELTNSNASSMSSEEDEEEDQDKNMIATITASQYFNESIWSMEMPKGGGKVRTEIPLPPDFQPSR
jgi:hypothetical protein